MKTVFNKAIKRITSVAAAFALIVAAGVGLSACGASDNNASEQKTLRIGVFSDKAPFGYLDADGKYAGYDVYFGNRLAEELNAKVEYVPTEAAARVDSLVSGKVDIVLANFTVTEERAEKVDFALPYQQVKLGIVSPTDAPITSIDQLQGKELIVIKGTTAEAWFEKNYPEIKLQKYDQYAEAQQATLDKRGAAWANDDTEVQAFVKSAKGFTVPDGVSSLGDEDFIAPAVKKGDTELYNQINDVIKKLAGENFFHKDYEAELQETYGAAIEDKIVIEGGVVSDAAKAEKSWYTAIQQ